MSKSMQMNDLAMSTYSNRRNLRSDRFYLESVYKLSCAVIPDVIRYPEVFEKPGFRLSTLPE
jgi:hypothetical protein